MPLILGNESKLCTVKPCMVDQSYLASCCKMQQLQPQRPTSTFLPITVCPLLECPTSSSICPQIPLSTNASLWISLRIHSKWGKTANQCWSPSIFGNVSNTLGDPCAAFECHPEYLLLCEAVYDFFMLGNRIIHCPNWETFEGKGGALITMLNNGHRPGLSQGDRVPGQPTSRQSWLLSPLNFQSTLTLYLRHTMCLPIPTLVWEVHKVRARPSYLYLQHLSSARHRDDTKCHQQK